MGLVVVDASGGIVCALREDGATPFRHDIALGKAWASVQMGVNSRALAERAKDLPVFMGVLGTTGGGKFIPQTGAVLIRHPDDGQILGAVGASGGTGDEDEAICKAGVVEAGLAHG